MNTSSEIVWAKWIGSGWTLATSIALSADETKFIANHYMSITLPSQDWSVAFTLHNIVDGSLIWAATS